MKGIRHSVKICHKIFYWTSTLYLVLWNVLSFSPRPKVGFNESEYDSILFQNLSWRFASILQSMLKYLVRTWLNWLLKLLYCFKGRLLLTLRNVLCIGLRNILFINFIGYYSFILILNWITGFFKAKEKSTLFIRNYRYSKTLTLLILLTITSCRLCRLCRLCHL